MVVSANGPTHHDLVTQRDSLLKREFPSRHLLTSLFFPAVLLFPEKCGGGVCRKKQSDRASAVYRAMPRIRRLRVSKTKEEPIEKDM